MKKAMKITSALLVVMMVVMAISPVFASEFTPGSVTPDTTGTSSVQTFGNRIVGILRVVGIIASVAVLIVLGIKYMMGSAEEKAEYKKTMLPYLIGAVLIFAASVIATIVYNFANSITA